MTLVLKRPKKILIKEDRHFIRYRDIRDKYLRNKEDYYIQNK